MKKTIIALSIIIGLASCKSTQNTSGTTAESNEKSSQVERPTDLDLSKKVKLEPKYKGEKKDPKQVQTIDKTKMYKMSIEKKDNTSGN